MFVYIKLRPFLLFPHISTPPGAPLPDLQLVQLYSNAAATALRLLRPGPALEMARRAWAVGGGSKDAKVTPSVRSTLRFNLARALEASDSGQVEARQMYQQMIQEVRTPHRTP